MKQTASTPTTTPKTALKQPNTEPVTRFHKKLDAEFGVKVNKQPQTAVNKRPSLEAKSKLAPKGRTSKSPKQRTAAVSTPTLPLKLKPTSKSPPPRTEVRVPSL